MRRKESDRKRQASEQAEAQGRKKRKKQWWEEGEQAAQQVSDDDDRAYYKEQVISPQRDCLTNSDRHTLHHSTVTQHHWKHLSLLSRFCWALDCLAIRTALLQI